MATQTKFSANRRTVGAAPRSVVGSNRPKVGAAKGGNRPTGAQWSSIREGGGGYNPNTTIKDIPD